MALATWWAGDALPDLPALAGFAAARATDDAALAALNRLDVAEVRARRAAGHRPYVGVLGGEPAAYGWVATAEASIGELGLSLRLPAGTRYLWDFATLPSAQGRGIYPRLLQAILRHEAREADRFWIIHAPENLPSGAGMEHAGLAPVGELSFRPDGTVGLAPLGDRERVLAGAELLGVPLIEATLSPCWRCGGLTQGPVEDAEERGAACWPPAPAETTVCTCAIPLRRPVTASAQPRP